MRIAMSRVVRHPASFLNAHALGLDGNTRLIANYLNR